MQEKTHSQCCVCTLQVRTCAAVPLARMEDAASLRPWASAVNVLMAGPETSARKVRQHCSCTVVHQVGTRIEKLRLHMNIHGMHIFPLTSGDEISRKRGKLWIVTTCLCTMMVTDHLALGFFGEGRGYGLVHSLFVCLFCVCFKLAREPLWT